MQASPTASAAEILRAVTSDPPTILTSLQSVKVRLAANKAARRTSTRNSEVLAGAKGLAQICICRPSGPHRNPVHTGLESRTHRCWKRCPEPGGTGGTGGTRRGNSESGRYWVGQEG